MKTNEFIGNWPAQNKDSWLRQIIEENAAIAAFSSMI